MIVKMRKLDILLYHREQEKFLEELRNLGVVHITSEQSVDSAATQEISANVQRAQRVIGGLAKLRREQGVTAISVLPTAVPELLSKYEECEARCDQIEQELASLKKDAAALSPWGSFDPGAVKRLADAGVTLKFYAAPRKKFGQLDRTNLRLEVISEQGGVVYFAAVYRGEAPEIAGAEEARLPGINLSDMPAKAAALEAERKEVLAKIEKMVGSISSIEKYRNDQFNNLKYEEARLSMAGAAEGKILKLSGWVPKENEAKLVIFLQDYPAYVEFRDPTPEDSVPVKLKNGKFTKLFEPVIGMYSLPSYREMDVTFFIAPFFVIFYGLCLNDVGYGCLITIAATIAMLKLSKSARPILVLGLILGLSTILCGFLGNGFFGASMFGEGSVFGGADPSYAVLGSYKEVVNGVQTSKELYPTMSLAILAGFIQLFLGMGIKTYLQLRDNGFWAGLQPLSSIFMALGIVVLGAKYDSFGLGLGFETFSIGNQDSFIAIGKVLKDIGLLNIGQPFGATLSFGLGEIFLVGGLALLLLFNSLDKAIFWRPLTGLWELFNYSTGLLSNVLSYLRLFALGLAGGLLAAAINQIAFMFITAKDGTVNPMSPGIAITVIVLLAGHALNFGLSGLGSFIHPLRLMFVEFYGAVGFQGGSKPFVPFSKVEKQ